MKLKLTLPGGARPLALAALLTLAGGPAPLRAQQAPPAGAQTALLARNQGLSSADLADLVVTDSYYDAGMGLTHTYLQQRVNGLTIHNAVGSVHTDKAGRVVMANARGFVAGAAALAAAPAPALSPEQAVVAATVALGLPRPQTLARVDNGARTAADGLLFGPAGISERDIPVRLQYTRQGNGLTLVWSVTIAELSQDHHRAVRLDAATGRLVDFNDYVQHEVASFAPQAAQHQARRRGAPAVSAPAFAPQAAQPLTPLGPARSLTVVTMPGENPIVAPRTSFPLASINTQFSPYGWQVGEGRAPSGFFADSYSLLSSGRQLTRGNNVVAFDNNSVTSTSSAAATTANLNSPLTSPDGGANLDFDFPLNPTLGPREPNNLAAGITNLFYWNNVVHDVMMSKGFDEASGNFQYKNLTTQGLGNDFVLAQAQDGSGRNNANFSTPPDGTSGRMRMYQFDNPDPSLQTLTITAPASAAGTYPFFTASFGPSLYARATPLTGRIVPVDDGSGATGNLGCGAFFTPVNGVGVSGNIALISRGTCPFVDKVKNAQNNGAIGVIIYDNSPTSTLQGLGGTDATVTIPAVLISNANGLRLLAATQSGPVTGTLTVGPSIDGNFDNGVVTHEYGHGISNRLTGGPANSSCLTNADSAQIGGEGWSDFFALWMTTRPGSDGSTNRYIGLYDSGDPFAQSQMPGFRNKPYSTNFSATGNNYTYAQLGTGASQYFRTHAVGEVWCTVLWDLNWQLIYRYGYNPDLYARTGGNNIALKLVLDGCKLQPCMPSFLDARDAIIAADQQNNGGANVALIWNVFARRGMGFDAKAGAVRGGVPQVRGVQAGFGLPPNIQPIVLSNRNGITTSGALEAFPNPAQDQLLVRAQVSSSTPVQVSLVDMLGRTVLQTSGSPALFQQAGIPVRTEGLTNGVYVVRVTTSAGTFTTKVTVQR